MNKLLKMEQLEQEINFSTEDMDTIDFAAVEPSVSSSSLLQMLQPEGTYTNGPVLDLHEYATPLSPSIPLTELGDSVLPHHSTSDAFDTPTSLPVTIVDGPSVDSISISTTMNNEENNGLDVTPLLLSGLQSSELSANLHQAADINSDCESTLNKDLLLENVPVDIPQAVGGCEDEFKGVLPSMTPVQINLPNFPNVTSNLLPLSTLGQNVIFASPSYSVPSPEICSTDVLNGKDTALKNNKIADISPCNNLLSIPSISQTDVTSNVLHGQQIRVEFNKISADTTIVKLCFGLQNDSGIKSTNQDLVLNQQILATLLNASKSLENSTSSSAVQANDSVCEDVSVINDKSNEGEVCAGEANESMNLDTPLEDEEDNKPLQQLKEEMAFALGSEVTKNHIGISSSSSQITPEINELQTSILIQENISGCATVREENIQEGDPVQISITSDKQSPVDELNTGDSEVKISSLLSDFKVKMKTLAKLDEISIQINDSQHQEIEGKWRWCCNKCDKSYTTKHNLIIHTLGHHGIKPHVCAICKRMFSQRSHLKTHILTHGNIRPHSCHICHRSFTQLSHVKRHISTHMEKRPYHCDECERGFAYPSELKAHQVKHQRDKDHKCDHCSASFDDPKKLTFHVKTTHKDPSELTCKECGREYTYPSQLRDHMVKHTGMRPYTCTECGMDFMKEHHLKSHIYTHSGMKPWECTKCSRTFNQKANMLRHMLIHEDQKKFECDVCHKTFSQPQTLKAHRVTHSDKKPYHCRICGKEFGRLHTLQGHMHVHLDSRPHICFCGAAFTLKGNLTRHKKVKHDLSDPSQCTEEEAAKILEIMSTKRRGPSSETGVGSDSCRDVGEPGTGNGESDNGKDASSPLCASQTSNIEQVKDLETLSCLKPNCNDVTTLLSLDTSPMVDNFHTYCAKDIITCDSQ